MFSTFSKFVLILSLRVLCVLCGSFFPTVIHPQLGAEDLVDLDCGADDGRCDVIEFHDYCFQPWRALKAIFSVLSAMASPLAVIDPADSMFIRMTDFVPFYSFTHPRDMACRTVDSTEPDIGIMVMLSILIQSLSIARLRRLSA